MFSGQTVDATSALVKFTYYGDLDLDGDVDMTDANTLESNFGKTGAIWTDGDLNYDGTVNTADFDLLALKYR